MARSMDRRFVFRRICLLVLLIAVLLQAGQQVQKYLAWYTVMGRTIEQVRVLSETLRQSCYVQSCTLCQAPKQHLPAVSFCPGYRPGERARGLWWLRPMFGWQERLNSAEEEVLDLEAMWKEINFELEETLTLAYLETGPGQYDVQLRFTKAKQKDAEIN